MQELEHDYIEIIEEESSFTSFDNSSIFTLTGEVKEEEKVGLEFKGEHKIKAYAVCPNIQALKKDRQILRNIRFYESKEWALHDSNIDILRAGGSLIGCEIDLTSSLDLLDRHDMQKLVAYSNNVIKNKYLKRSDEHFTNKLVTNYCKQHNISIIRRTMCFKEMIREAEDFTDILNSSTLEVVLNTLGLIGVYEV